MNIILIIILAILISITIYQIALLTYDSEDIENILSFCTIIAIFLLFIGYNVFGKKKPIHNKTIRKSLYISSIMLLIYTLIFNWEKIDASIKTASFASIIGILIWFVYSKKKFKDLY